MSLKLHDDEVRVARTLMQRTLRDAGAGRLSETEAHIYTAILCRRYRASERELVAASAFLVQDLGGGATPDEIAVAVARLRGLPLLRAVPGSRDVAIEASDPWREAWAATFATPDADDRIARTIDDAIAEFAEDSPRERDLIERLGWATWEAPREALQQAIRGAKSRLRLGVYSSKSMLPQIEKELLEVWPNREAFRVEVLMFSPELAARVERDPALARDVEEMTQRWFALYEEVRRRAAAKARRPEFALRHITDREMVAFHRVVLVDDGDWALNVHRPGLERGIEGMVYRGGCRDGHPSNVYHILDRYWQDAWARAASTTRAGRIRDALRPYAHHAAIVLLVVVALAVERGVAPGGRLLGVGRDAWIGGLVGAAVSDAFVNWRALWRPVRRMLAVVAGAAHRELRTDADGPGAPGAPSS